ncbi:hypothetical protein NE237_008142 [Protea cynaroides]|uniref:Fe2OG dioxygenase domain-containing protein n=1 Tax=Protea cynaroides TaxID=273540 RepID=A0A9Q0QWU7_9MAGN|nr:hypothetical protein NE237_008142 [Protea cynaroides]
MEYERREEEEYDRAKELKQFDDSKTGVKGLIESGITSIPRFFIHPPESLPSTANIAAPPPVSNIISTIDLSGFESDRRSIIVDQIHDASSKLGLFQVINHGIPSETIDRTIAGIKAFNEQPPEIRMRHYSRDIGRSVSYSSNFDLYRSKAATWKDTITVRWGPNIDISEIPEICRSELVEWHRQVKQLGEMIMEMLSEGTRSEGCQIKHGEHWVDVHPVPNAIIINIGDLLQIISNETYRSIEHRVLAHRLRQPRISVAVFFNSNKKEDFYGPLPDLISPDKPALYRQFTLSEFLTKFFTRERDDKSLISNFRI